MCWSGIARGEIAGWRSGGTDDGDGGDGGVKEGDEYGRIGKRDSGTVDGGASRLGDFFFDRVGGVVGESLTWGEMGSLGCMMDIAFHE